MLAKVSPKKSRKLEEYKVAKAIIQHGLPGSLVTKWPCLRGQSVRTGQKIVRGDKFVFKLQGNLHFNSSTYYYSTLLLRGKKGTSFSYKVQS